MSVIREERHFISELVEPMSWWRRILARLPGFCGYCGRWMKPCAFFRDNVCFSETERGARCCPNLHEGYRRERIAYGHVYVRWWWPSDERVEVDAGGKPVHTD